MWCQFNTTFFGKSFRRFTSKLIVDLRESVWYNLGTK